MTEIVIDTREHRSRVHDLLVEATDLRCRVGRLGVGDYLVGGRVLVERKTLDDFGASVIDARVFDQANRLARSPLAGVLLLEGRHLRRRIGRGQL